jgi:hypothetical protein
MGIARTLMTMDAAHPARGKGATFAGKKELPVIDTHRPVKHNAEWLAEKLLGKNWLADFKAGATKPEGHLAVRVVKRRKV